MELYEEISSLEKIERGQVFIPPPTTETLRQWGYNPRAALDESVITQPSKSALKTYPPLSSGLLGRTTELLSSVSVSVCLCLCLCLCS